MGGRKGERREGVWMGGGGERGGMEGRGQHMYEQKLSAVHVHSGKG